MILSIWQDVRYGVRMLLKNPGFALIAIGSIGIGVGATTAMFSLADGLLLRPLGVPRPGEVVSVVGTSPERGFQPPGLSYPDYVDLRERTRTFESLVAYQDVLTGFDARPDQPALRTIGTAVSGGLFDAMSIRPALGRFFRADEDAVPGRDPVVVVDHRAWRDRFGADPAIVGRRVRIGSTDFTVIGVSPESFKGIAGDVWPTFYVPLAMLPQMQNPPSDVLTRRDIRALDVKGRLKPDVTMTQARDEIARIGRDLSTEHPEANRSQGLTVRTELDMRMAQPDGMLILMLMALAAAVLLVACANVAGLLTSRAPVRAREVALRLTIGAGRLRLVRQLVTESLIIAVGGAMLGLVIAYGGIQLFRQIELPTEIPLKLYFEIDRRVLTIGLIVAAASAVLSSLIPAWQTTRTDLVTTIKGTASAGRARQWGRQSLVCAQVALSLMLLTVTAALYAGFNARFAQGPGYRTERLLLMRFDDGLAGYDRDQARQFYTLLKEQAGALPGVTSVALTTLVPMKTDTIDFLRVAPEGIRLPDEVSDVRIFSSRVDEAFFSTLAIPIVAGRSFTSGDDEDAPRVAVVNQTFASRYWPGQDVLGKRVRVQGFDGRSADWFEVVGVAADSRYTWIGEATPEFIYVPRMQSVAAQTTIVVATTGDAASLTAPLRDAVRSIDPNMPVFGVRTMEDLYQSRGIRVANIVLGLVGGMGTMGLLLALVGLYGLVAYAVSRRTREIGIRMAVGAVPRSVLGMVLRRGVVLTLAGLTIGTVGSVAVGRLIQGAIPGVGDFGPGTFAVVVPALFAVTLLAAYIPARRAAKVDPLLALRAE
jgi:predicted permease